MLSEILETKKEVDTLTINIKAGVNAKLLKVYTIKKFKIATKKIKLQFFALLQKQGAFDFYTWTKERGQFKKGSKKKMNLTVRARARPVSRAWWSSTSKCAATGTVRSPRARSGDGWPEG